MPFIPSTIVKGQGFKVYKGTKIKTKAATLRDALKIAKAEDLHVPLIDFIPAKFTLQLHGWFPPEAYKNIKEISSIIRSDTKAGRDPIKRLKGKWHYDLRVKKESAPTWFGITLFRAPWTGTADNKVLGTVKGYQSITKGGAKLAKFLLEVGPRLRAQEGIAERRDKVEWMKIKERWFEINSPGNPTKNQPAAMVAIEFFKPAVLHRRELDFFDLTLIGDVIKGRYYDRLVERKLSLDEQTKEQRKAGKIVWGLQFFFWKAKDQFKIPDMLAVSAGKKELDPIPAPPPSGEPRKKRKELKPPLATRAFH